jgi:Endonuclease-reverse transcriptase
MNSDITAVRFLGENGYVSIFNIYNKITNNKTISCLDQFIGRHSHLVRPTETDHTLWLSDFNRHHPIWEDETNLHLYEPEEFISPLIDLLYKHNMILALPKGIPTYQTCAGNWTRPDSVWRSSSADDPIIRCDILPNIRPLAADHLPIITVINLPLPRSMILPSLDFRNADWPKINTLLKAKLEAESPAVQIRTQEQFISKVDMLIEIITDVLHENLDELKPSPFSRRWWTKELTELKKEQNWLSNKLYKLRDVCNHPIHVEFRASANKFKEVMIETCKQHWIDWLESIEQQEIYTANKYLVSEPTNYSSTRIPTLRTNINGIKSIAEDNETKVKELAKSFFPPPPVTSSVPPNHKYPTPLKGIHFYSRAHIRQVFKTFSPYKAPG